MPFSEGFYYIKQKHSVGIEILNLGLERNLRNLGLYANKELRLPLCYNPVLLHAGQWALKK